MSFWQAINRIEQQVGLSLNASLEFDKQSTPHSMLKLQGKHCKYTLEHGLFRLRLLSIHAERDISLTDPQPEKSKSELIVSFAVNVEPKYRLLSVTTKELIATDETGKQFVIRKDESTPVPTPSFHVDHGFYQFINTQNINTWLFTSPTRTTGQIKKLQGKVSALFVVDLRPVTVAIKFRKANQLNAVVGLVGKKGREIRVGNQTLIILDQYIGKNNRYNIHLKVPGKGSRKWFSRVHLEDKNSNRYVLVGQGFSGSNNVNDPWELSLIFSAENAFGKAPPNLGPAARVVFENWQMVTADIPFEFRNIPLP